MGRVKELLLIQEEEDHMECHQERRIFDRAPVGGNCND